MMPEKVPSADGASLHEDASDSDCMSVVTVHVPTKCEADNVQIPSAENNLVFWIRVIVVAVLVVSTVSVTLVVYFYTSNTEQDAFEEQFISDSLKVFESVGTSLDLIFGAVDIFIVRAVSYAKYSNSTWPFVTIPDFAVQAAKLLGSSASIHCNVYPLVSKNQCAVWEPYSLLNDAWVEESINMQARNKNYHGPILTEYETLGSIHGAQGVIAESDPGPFMPSWQLFRITTPIIGTVLPLLQQSDTVWTHCELL
jgi:hypothetical protein